MNRDFLKLLQDRVAEIAVGPSALRNQGAKNVVTTARSFLKRIDLRNFTRVSRSGFSAQLDSETVQLKRRFPSGARNWGAARKALNIFLRDVLYHHYLCRAYNFDRLEKWLELPLDRYVAEALKAEPEGRALPRWKSIKSLTPEVNKQYQEVAKIVAERKGYARVHLDLMYWRAAV